MTPGSSKTTYDLDHNGQYTVAVTDGKDGWEFDGPSNITEGESSWNMVGAYSAKSRASFQLGGAALEIVELHGYLTKPGGEGETRPEYNAEFSGKTFYIKCAAPPDQVEKKFEVVIPWKTKASFTSYENGYPAASEWTVDGKDLGTSESITVGADMEPGRYDVIATKNGDSDTMILVIAKVEIIHPRTKDDLEEGEELKDIFSKTTPYCYENQGVSKEAFGHIDQQRIKKIEGKIIPNDLKYEWSLTKAVGTLNIDPPTLTPEHSPPDTAAIAGTTGYLVLKLKDYPNIKDTKKVVIFKDHLARDVSNFKDGKNCLRKNGVNGIELKDGSLAEGIQLGCSLSFVHAHKGVIGNAHTLWIDLRDNKNWRENIGQKYKWKAGKKYRTPGYGWEWFTHPSALALKWNDKVWIGKINIKIVMKDGKPKVVKTRTMLHPSTVIKPGDGGTAITYSGDTVKGKFIHRTVGWYYKNVLKNKIIPRFRKIWILQPTSR